MRLTAKPIIFGAPLLVAAGTFILLWILLSGVGGTGSPLGLVWNVELTQRDAAGNVLYNEVFHNAITGQGFDIAMERLIDKNSTGSGGEGGTFDQIVLLNTAVPIDNLISPSRILSLVDGGPGDGVAGSAGSPDNNPADGGFTGGATGVGAVNVTFFATADASPAVQMMLVKAAVEDNASAQTEIAAVDILAQLTISVDLATTDTLTVTWTITAS